MRSRLRLAVMASACAVGTTFLVFACYTPTSMTLDIYTDVKCRPNGALAPRTALYVGPTLGPNDEPQADTFACETQATESHIGSLTVAADGDREARVRVHVVMNTTGGGTAICKQAFPSADPKIGLELYRTCINVSRTFKFVPHTERRLRVRLDQACLGKFCPAGTTCALGVCTKDDVDDADFTETPDGAIVDGSSPDGASDAGIDAETDAQSSSCTPVLWSATTGSSRPIAVNSKRVYWVEKIDATNASVLSVPAPNPSKASPRTHWSGDAVDTLAVDESVLWFGATLTGIPHVVRMPAEGTKDDAIMTTLSGPVEAIAMSGGIAYVSVNTTGNTSALFFGTLTKFDTLQDGTGTQATGGTSLAALPTRLFALKVRNIAQFELPWTDAGPEGNTASPVNPIRVATSPAKSGGVAFVTMPAAVDASLAAVNVTDAGNSIVLHARGTDATGPIAADDEFIFHVAASPTELGLRIYRTTNQKPAGPGQAPSTLVEGTSGVGNIGGVALGADCVYFTANGATTYDIRSVPKKPETVKGTGDGGKTAPGP